jgi:hypothetical protein
MDADNGPSCIGEDVPGVNGIDSGVDMSSTSHARQLGTLPASMAGPLLHLDVAVAIRDPRVGQITDERMFFHLAARPPGMLCPRYQAGPGDGLHA